MRMSLLLALSAIALPTPASAQNGGGVEPRIEVLVVPAREAMAAWYQRRFGVTLDPVAVEITYGLERIALKEGGGNPYAPDPVRWVILDAASAELDNPRRDLVHVDVDGIKNKLIFSKIKGNLGLDRVRVSIVGAGLHNAPGYAARMFGTLADAKVNIEMISTSEVRITCMIAEDELETALRAEYTFDYEGGWAQACHCCVVEVDTAPTPNSMMSARLPASSVREISESLRIDTTVDGSAYSGAGSRIGVARSTSAQRLRMNSTPVW